MTDKFTPLSIEKLYKFFYDNKKATKGFGLNDALIFDSAGYGELKDTFFGKPLDTPFGVAAGPHTQLSQNIVMAWLSGARYIELKTVQVLDELEIAKPCIDMQDEGYNCEWSQELKIEESFNEYLNAWIVIHLIQHLKDPKRGPGLIFNMSLGYNYAGILSQKVQWFLEKMQHCAEEKNSKIKSLKAVCPEILNVQIPDCISDNVTLSTMHGCPPDEIEKITSYLIKERKLHTVLKLNPTLLGKDELRHVLNTVNGFYTEVPDIAFEHDLKYEQATAIIKRLLAAASENKVFFGLKLTNTLESLNNRPVFDSTQESMYMSGRALHPISIQLTEKLQQDFGGKLAISFSAGADCFNLPEVLSCGLFPVTVSSDVLKPGGYSRLLQYADNCKEAFMKMKAENRADFILKKSNTSFDTYQQAALSNLKQYAADVLKNKNYKKDIFREKNIKTSQKLGTYDCINAPCTLTCPTHQDIPEYLFYASKGEWDSALMTVLRTNPFPNVLGMVCDHKCQSKCTRINYDEDLRIRDVKWFVSQAQEHRMNTEKLPAKGFKVAVIGAGPSGLSCAYFLTLMGVEVTVFESKSVSGGMISEAIPHFRLKAEALQKDIERIKSMGVDIHFNAKIDKESFAKIKEGFNCIYIAVGAQENKKLMLKGENNEGVLDPIAFLSDLKNQKDVGAFADIAVIGGGNTACDVARAAHRMLKGKGKVTVVYRRTIREMPADKEEIEALLNEKIHILELTAPVEIISENGKVSGLLCRKMALAGMDASGRSQPVPVEGSEFLLPFDAVVPALGQNVVLDFMDSTHLKMISAYQTNLEGVFMGGDALRGASTIVNAVGDGRKAASHILSSLIDYEVNKVDFSTGLSYDELMSRKSWRRYSELPHAPVNALSETAPDMPFGPDEIMQEAARCLFCNELCNICVSVCPNKANYCYQLKPFSMVLPLLKINNGAAHIEGETIFEIKQQYQIVNIGDFCNECGNCNTFCPTSGAPYLEKPKVCLTTEAFNAVDKGYYLCRKNGVKVLVYKEDDFFATLSSSKDGFIYETDDVCAWFSQKFELKDYTILNNEINEISFVNAAGMMVLHQGLSELFG